MEIGYFFLRDSGGRAAGKESLRFLFFVAAGGGLQTMESWEAGIFLYGPTCHANIIYCGQKFESSKCL
jgi:hypothetical protein